MTQFGKRLAAVIGQPVTLCAKCRSMLAHRGGQPLPCTRCKSEEVK
jgi:exosome complex RNA-binding protein Csl4